MIASCKSPWLRSSLPGRSLAAGFAIALWALAAAALAGAEPALFESRALGDEPADAHALVVSDLDADGDLDLLAGRGGHWPAPDRLWRGDGRGHFSGPESFGGRRSTFALAVGELTGDAHLDLLGGGVFSQRAELFAGDGSGGFVRRAMIGPRGAETRAFGLGDLDGDGDLDVVMVNKSTARDGRPAPGVSARNQVLLNDGAGGLLASRDFGSDSGQSIAVALGDLDGDGDLDVACANAAGEASRIYWNDGSGRLVGVLPLGPEQDDARAIALGDVDGDGDLDLVLGHWRGANTVLLHREGGFFGRGRPFGAPGLRTRAIALGDMDGDGDLDAVTGNLGQPNHVHHNDGRGRFGEGVPFGSADGATWALGLGDLDGDGRLDVVEALSNRPLTLHFGRGPARARSAAQSAEKVR